LYPASSGERSIHTKEKEMKTMITSAICVALAFSSNALAQDVVNYVDPGNQATTQQAQPLVQNPPATQGQATTPGQATMPGQPQPFVSGQTYIPGQTYFPGTIVQQPYYPPYVPNQPIIQPWPGSGSFTPGYVPPVYYPVPDPNPVVGYVPNTVTSITYDIYGNPIVSSQSQTVLQSATGPLRNTAIAGTTRAVNRYELDQYGRQVHVTGTEWLGADGIWHGNLNRQTLTVGPGGVIQNQNDIINYSQSEPKKDDGSKPDNQ
jgi:hypothetical protein